MNNFSIKTKLTFGSRAIQKLSELPYKNALVITDGFLEQSGMVAKMVQHLPQGCTYRSYSDVKPDPSQELVDKGVGVLEECQPDLLIAFGGGSCIDASKAILFTAHERGYKLPYFVAIPTTAGTGSEVTNFAVITRGSDKIVLIDDLMQPDAAILEADFTKTVPAKITADTGLDVLTHALEAYVSNSGTPFTAALAAKACRLVFANLPVVYKDGLAMRSRERMIEASCAAGIAFTNAGLGINHSLAHALGGRFHAAHGRLNAVLLPYVMRFHLQQLASRTPYDELANELCLPNAEALLQKVEELLATLNVEHSLAELPQIDAANFNAQLEAMAEAAYHDRCTPTNVSAVSRQNLVNILRAAFDGCTSCV